MRREVQITVPELALVAGTRAALGVGLGLLLAGRLSDEQRRAAGWALLLVGAATTVPIALEVFGRPHPAAPVIGGGGDGRAHPVRQQPRLAGVGSHR